MRWSVINFWWYTDKVIPRRENWIHLLDSLHAKHKTPRRERDTHTCFLSGSFYALIVYLGKWAGNKWWHFQAILSYFRPFDRWLSHHLYDVLTSSWFSFISLLQSSCSFYSEATGKRDNQGNNTFLPEINKAITLLRLWLNHSSLSFISYSTSSSQS